MMGALIGMMIPLRNVRIGGLSGTMGCAVYGL